MTTKPPLTSCTPSDARAMEMRYYLAMAAPFGIDLIVSAIFTSILGLPELFLRNLIYGAVALLAGIYIGARRLFRPIHDFLLSGTGFSAIERNLTQLPLRSAMLAMYCYLPLLLLRLILPLVLGAAMPGIVLGEILLPTWLDAILTVIVQLIFIFVAVYFLVSGYLEQLCNFLFEKHGVNLGLFYGSFSAKIAVAMGFTALGPLSLIAGELFSYSGERLVLEVLIDLSASAFGLFITLFWVSRSLTRPLGRLGSGMARVASGDLDLRLPVTSNEEIGELTAHFNRMVDGLRERQRIRETFGKYVSEQVASALLQQPGSERLSGETGEATLLFTDIEGFTTLSERLAPDLLIKVLNEYLEVVIDPIQRHGGMINSFIGDGLFASFNMPLANPRHAASALAAGIEIEQALRDREFSGGVKLRTRIGINTGIVIGGTIGAGERLSYTLLGDAVNTAARLQELNKQYGTSILFSGTTCNQLPEGHALRQIGDVPIRGRTETLMLYTLADDIAT